MPDPILIRCPHCAHALTLPEEFLGQVVSCLECRSPFRAPVRDGDTLTDPVKLSRPTRIPARIFVPTFGLLLLGFAGLFVNLYLAWWFRADPQGAAKFAEANMYFLLETEPPAEKAKDGKPPTDAEEKQSRDDQAERQQQIVKETAGKVSAEKMLRVRLAFAVVSLGVVAGGFGFALRRGYYFCYFACLLAALNSPDIGCCFLGVVVGLWGFMVLISDEGQKHFGRMK